MTRKTGIRVLVALVLVFFAVIAVEVWLGTREDKPAAPEAGEWPGVALPSLTAEPGPLEGEPYNLLVLGLGSSSRGGRAAEPACEAVTVAHVDEKLKRVALLSIPTATYLDVRGYGKLTLREVYEAGGVELARTVVEDITGLAFRNHLALGQESLAGLVDMLGGVEFNLQEDVEDPRWGKLEAGPALLDGIGALLVTEASSYPGGELGRIRARQAFTITAANQVHDSASLPGMAWMLNLGRDWLQTDLDTADAVRLAREFGSWPVVDVSAGVAPGNSGRIGSKEVYLLDQEKMEEAVRSINASATAPSYQ